MALETSIDPFDIFKYCVVREDNSNRKDAKEYRRVLLQRCKDNIFSKEYWVLYALIRELQKKEVDFTFSVITQLLNTNADKWLAENQLDELFHDKELNYEGKKELLMDMVLGRYQEMSEEDCSEMDFAENLYIYIEDYCKQAYIEVSTNNLAILNRGKKIGRRMYQGVEDMLEYETRAKTRIRDIQDSSKIAIMEDFNSWELTPKKVMELYKETSGQLLAETGLSDLDKAMNGISRGQITVIQSHTGGGKTRFSMNLMHNAITKHGSKVLFIALEQPKQDVFAMLTALESTSIENIFSITDSNIVKDALSEHERKIVVQATERLLDEDKVARHKITTKPVEARLFKEYLGEVWESGFQFDMVVLDNFPLVSVGSGEVKYQALEDMSSSFVQLTKNYRGVGFGLVVLNQLTDEGSDALTKGNYANLMSLGRGSRKLNHDADNVLTVYRSEEAKQKQQIKVIRSKVRKGEPGDTDYEYRAGQCFYAPIMEDDEFL